jgi:phage host-nuclease inhibitor protein Gam
MSNISSSEIIKLRKQAGRYKELHERAVKRLESQSLEHTEKVDKLKISYDRQIDTLKSELISLKETIRTLQDLHFGKSSESSVSVAGDLKTGKKKRHRKRGQQVGKKGHGRRRHRELPCEEEFIELSEEETRCSICVSPLKF